MSEEGPVAEPSPMPESVGARTPMTIDALLATLRRHVAMFRDEPDFYDYIINLALYLLELHEGKIPVEEIAEPEPMKRAVLAPDSRGRMEAATKRKKEDNCPICGASTRGKHVCPHCGHMVH